MGLPAHQVLRESRRRPAQSQLARGAAGQDVRRGGVVLVASRACPRCRDRCSRCDHPRERGANRWLRGGRWHANDAARRDPRSDRAALKGPARSCRACDILPPSVDGQMLGRRDCSYQQEGDANERELAMAAHAAAQPGLRASREAADEPVALADERRHGGVARHGAVRNRARLRLRRDVGRLLEVLYAARGSNLPSTVRHAQSVRSRRVQTTASIRLSIC